MRRLWTEPAGHIHGPPFPTAGRQLGLRPLATPSSCPSGSLAQWTTPYVVSCNWGMAGSRIHPRHKIFAANWAQLQALARAWARTPTHSIAACIRR